jgi:hypothetical protein
LMAGFFLVLQIGKWGWVPSTSKTHCGLARLIEAA